MGRDVTRSEIKLATLLKQDVSYANDEARTLAVSHICKKPFGNNQIKIFNKLRFFVMVDFVYLFLIAFICFFTSHTDFMSHKF